MRYGTTGDMETEVPVNSVRMSVAVHTRSNQMNLQILATAREQDTM